MIGKIKRLAQAINENEKRIKSLETKIIQNEGLLKENYWANVFQSTIRGSKWFKDVPLSAGRWAGGFTLFYVLYRILDEIKPQNILELGLGETTKMIQAYKKYHNNGATCITVEQDKNWIDFRLKQGISPDQIKILLSDVHNIKLKDFETLVYKDLVLELKKENKTFDFVLIDGPWGSPHYSRSNIIELINDHLLSDECIIIMDDYNRLGEKETVEEIKNLWKKNERPFITGYYNGEKDVVIVASEKYKYLESL